MCSHIDLAASGRFEDPRERGTYPSSCRRGTRQVLAERERVVAPLQRRDGGLRRGRDAQPHRGEAEDGFLRLLPVRTGAQRGELLAELAASDVGRDPGCDRSRTTASWSSCSSRSRRSVWTACSRARMRGIDRQAVIVELKQWERSRAFTDRGLRHGLHRRAIRDVLHPSAQVGGYERYLRDVHTTFSDGSVGMSSCAYAHNARSIPMRSYGRKHTAAPGPLAPLRGRSGRRIR